MTFDPVGFEGDRRHFTHEQKSGRRSRDRAGSGGRIGRRGRASMGFSINAADVNDEHAWPSHAARNGNMALRFNRDKVW